MDDVKDIAPSFEELTTGDQLEPEAGHDAYVRRQVQTALDQEKAGVTYRDLRVVAEKFGFNAR